VETIAKFATSVNEQTENIGARRLHTIMEKVLDELSFEASDLKKKNVKIDAAYVNKQLAEIVKNQDLKPLHPVNETRKWKIETLADRANANAVRAHRRKHLLSSAILHRFSNFVSRNLEFRRQAKF